jgi:hypothetical protein
VLVGGLDTRLADHIVGGVPVLRVGVQLLAVDVADVAEQLGRCVAEGVRPLGGERDGHPGEQALVLGQVDDGGLGDPDRDRNGL